MHLVFRLSPYILVWLILISGFQAWGQELNIHVGFSLTPEFTTGSVAGKTDDPMSLLNNGRFTYKPEAHFRFNFLEWLALEGGIYQKDRGIGGKKPILDPFGNVIDYSHFSSHYTYLGFPLKLHLSWQDIHVAIGPSLEMLTGFGAYQNGHAVPVSFIPSRNMEVVLSCQVGWEAHLASNIYGFVAINMDAQWQKALQPTEYRFASMGLMVGLNVDVLQRK